MKIYKKSISCINIASPTNSIWDFYPFNTFKPEDLCYFDIETTGLSADTADIYLIGAGQFNCDSFNTIQWFADDYKSEKDILVSFLEYLKSFKLLFQYNGNTFDIPFIRKKCKKHNLDCSVINNIKNIDLYVSLRRYSKMLGLPNKKLKSFEKYVGIDRDDKYDGGQLIKVYVDYMHAKYLHHNNSEMLDKLLLHNLEDVTGLTQVSSLLFLKELNKLPVEFISACVSGVSSCKYITAIYKCSLPGHFTFNTNTESDTPNHKIYCTWSDNMINLKIPVVDTTLKYFFADYKDYYYMINEGTVMHKSVAIYTDTYVRRKAKKAECYTMKQSLFIPINKQGFFSENYKVFRDDYTSKDYYIELTPDILNNPAWFKKYYSQII